MTRRRVFESLTGSERISAMANTKSAIKAARKALRFAARNRTVKTRLKTLHKKFDAAVTAGNARPPPRPSVWPTPPPWIGR